MEATFSKRTLLLLDAATPLVQAGLWKGGRWIAWKSSRTEATRSLFEVTGMCLAEGAHDIQDVEGFLFCEGPGSMLGIRMTSMAIRGWLTLFDSSPPVFSYHSLRAAGQLLLAQGRTPPFSVISDARRGYWHLLKIGTTNSPPSEVHRIEASQLRNLPGPFFRMEERRGTNCPVPSAGVAYDFSQAAEVFHAPGVLRRNDRAGIHLSTPPEFKKWTPERHRHK